MIFEKIRTVPTGQELLDKAFRRGSRAKKGKQDKRKAEESFVLTTGNILADNLQRVVRDFPSFDSIHPFYRELVDILVGVEEMKKNLARVQWAGNRIHQLTREAIRKIRANDPSFERRAATGRFASILHQVNPSLEFLGQVRDKLKHLPDVVQDEPTIVVAGYPNVGKSSFIDRVSSAKPRIESYPFTTKGLAVGHLTLQGRRCQIIDTPGLLDRPLQERNQIELQAITALRHLAGVILFLLDPTETCGYTLEEQERLYHQIEAEFNLPIIAAYNKKDIFKNMPRGEFQISTLTGEGIDRLLEALAAVLQEKDRTCKFAQEGI